MMKTRRCSILGLIVATLSYQVLLASPVSVLLEKGIYTEETVGDRDRAIQIYQQIADDERANRRYVAEALFRLGRCQAEQGKPDQALAALQRLTGQFPDQGHFVNLAKGLIAQLEPAPWLRELEGTRLVYRLVLDLGAKGKPAGTRSYRINQTDVLLLSWELDNALAKKAHQFQLQLRPEDELNLKPVVLAEALEATRRRIRIDDLAKVTAGVYRLKFKALDKDGRAITETDVGLQIEQAQYTQIMAHDHQGSGRCGFTSVQYMINLGREPLTHHSFRNSDFVHVESIHDGEGNKLKFDTVHQDRHYRYRVELKQAIKPNETYALSQQGWSTCRHRRAASGNEAEQTYSMTHSPGTSFPTRRVEFHRLPSGAELVSVTPSDLPRHVLEDGRTEIVVDKVIPARGSLSVQFTFRGGDGSTESGTGTEMVLQPAPWQSGEVLRYRLMSKTGLELGTQIWTVNELDSDGKPCWCVEQKVLVPSANMLVLSRVVAEKESFEPLTGWTSHTLGTVSATYLPGKVLLQQKGNDKAREVTVPGTVYDNEQVLYLMRRLPLAEGYQSEFPIMSILSGVPSLQCSIEVTGRETVKAGGKSYDAWKILVQVFMGSMKAVEQTAWFALDGHVPVKFVTDQMDLELAEQLPAPRKVAQATKYGLSFEVPKGWFAYELPTAGKGSEIVSLLPPAPGLECTLYRTLRQPAGAQAKDIAMKDIERVSGYYGQYEPIKDLEETTSIGGFPAYICAAAFNEQGTSKKEYRIYQTVGPTVYWWVYQSDEETFEGKGKKFAAMVKSATFDHKADDSGDNQ